MSRVATPAEKVLAIKSIYGRLIEELGLDPEPVVIAQTVREVSKKDEPLMLTVAGAAEVTWRIDPVVMAALIDAATRVAMGTDTRDMGIMGPNPERFNEPAKEPLATDVHTLPCGCLIDDNQLLATAPSCDDPSHQR